MEKLRVFCDRCGKEIEGVGRRWILARFESPAYNEKSYDICSDCKNEIVGGGKC